MAPSANGDEERASRKKKLVVFRSHLRDSLYMLRAEMRDSIWRVVADVGASVWGGAMASDLDDSIDIERWDPTAEFLELYSHNYPRLQFYLMSLLPFVDDAADVLQETSLVLWKKFDTYTTGTNFFAWACKIARLQALKYQERRGKAALMFSDELLDTLAVEAAEDRFAPANSLRYLQQCMGRLSQRDQQLIRTRYEPGMSVTRLADNIGRTANSLSKSLGRIRRSLLECIERKRVAASRD